MSGMEKPTSVPSSQCLWKNQLLCLLMSGCPGDLPKSLFFPLLEHSIRLGTVCHAK